LEADFSHAPAGFLFNSLIEIVLTPENYLGRAIHASTLLAPVRKRDSAIQTVGVGPLKPSKTHCFWRVGI